MAWDLEVSSTGGSHRRRAIKSRLIGVVALIIGVLHILGGVGWFLVELRRPSAGHSPYSNMVFVASGLVSVALGLWLCTRIPYRPDLGDISATAGKAGGYTPEYVAARKRLRRAWWTGDPLPDTTPRRLTDVAANKAAEEARAPRSHFVR